MRQPYNPCRTDVDPWRLASGLFLLVMFLMSRPSRSLHRCQCPLPGEGILPLFTLRTLPITAKQQRTGGSGKNTHTRCLAQTCYTVEMSKAAPEVVSFDKMYETSAPSYRQSNSRDRIALESVYNFTFVLINIVL